MIKPAAIAKIKFILGTLLLFAMSYALQVNLTIPLFLLSLVIYMNSTCKANGNHTSFNLLNLTLLFVIFFTVSFFVAQHGWSPLMIPFCALAMLATILFNETRISLLITLAAAVSVSAVNGSNFHLEMLFMISGILSIVLVRHVRKRNAIIRAGLIAGIVQALTWFFIMHFNFNMRDLETYVTLLFNGIISSIIVIGILPVFEYLFRTVTNISLLELADFDNPILKRLMMETPGTYQHSLVVGNLSEAAAQAIGAHALLARIGAYYHDIGKLSRPEYFSENQDMLGNKHEALTPSMSKTVIMDHVKEGVEIAKKFRLNWRLVEFIQQHHGTSLVYYFYRRALEEMESDQKIEEEGFRYAGPKPSTKETAIVLLADSVEAATRALKEHTPVEISELVHKIINNKFI
ncbi:MAG: HDIG domain-containing metalloprotein, partial [Deltaproteobacteria bacterium]